MNFFEDLFKKKGSGQPDPASMASSYTLAPGGGMDVADTTEKASRRPEYSMLNPAGDPTSPTAEADYDEWFQKNKAGLGGNSIWKTQGMQGLRR